MISSPHPVTSPSSDSAASPPFDRSPSRESDVGRVFPSGVRIGRTSYGLGVFAFAFIPRETPIGRVSGKLVHDPHYGSDYCINAGDDKVLEPGLPFCYINHCCEPNCQLLQYVRENEVDEDESLEIGALSSAELDLDDDGAESYVDAVLPDDDHCFFGDGAAAERVDDAETTAETGPCDEEPDSDDDMMFEDDVDAEIWVEAIRDILPGEELTIDYAWPADRAVKCLCGSSRCRGWIVDPDELDLIAES